MIALYWTKPWNWHNELQKLKLNHHTCTWYCSSCWASLQMYYTDGVLDIGLDVINHVMFLAGFKKLIYFTVMKWFSGLLVEPRSSCETIVLRLCVCVCPSAMTLKWYNIVNSQYIVIQFYRRVDIPQRYVGIEIWHSPSTRITAFVTTLAVSPKSLKCNISITNCPIALKFDAGEKHQQIHTKHCQWLDKHTNCIRDKTFCIPQFFKCNISMKNCPIALKFCTEAQLQWRNIYMGWIWQYDQIRAIKGKYDHIRVINFTFVQI